MNTNLIHTDTGSIVHVSKEFDSSKGWHKGIVGIGISDEKDPLSVNKAYFDSREKLDMLISILQGYREHFDK